ncbi:unnamed protein product [Trifolium pratense]|uniref:Uncharacterized protein n=1 Tax=Trifolium pratense TaxID=57577 RepID=A0ACB0M6H1_TRIPR|nr:unnamed protein product [Trifolium pratense]
MYENLWESSRRLNRSRPPLRGASSRSVVRRPIKWLKPSSHRLEPQGGILVLWKSKDISVDVLQDDSQFVHMKVVPEKKSECLLIALYAKPTESLKAWLWKQVLQMWEV